MSKNDYKNWDTDVNVFFAQADLVLKGYLVPGGVYGLKMLFWKNHLSEDERLAIIHRAWSIFEAFTGFPFWEAACLSELIRQLSEKVLWHGTILEAAVCADLLERLKRSYPGGFELAFSVRLSLLLELQTHKMYQLVDLEATDYLNTLQAAAHKLQGAPLSYETSEEGG